MHGHFSRVRFDPHDRFSAVVALQGRVDVEADHNEHTAILQHYLRTLTMDVLGRHAFTTDDAFRIGLVADAGTVEDLSIGLGHGYVDGLLVENLLRPDKTWSLYDQPDAHFSARDHKLPEGFNYFVYLEVWERLVTYVEQPEIRDVALGPGGPDSSARAKVVWQVRFGDPLKPAPPKADPASLRGFWDAEVQPGLLGVSPGTMTATLQPGKEDDLCALSPAGGYRGLENQLYRVEIHTGGVLGGAGGQAPTFKWSRDNGSVVFPMRREGREIFLTSLGRDDRYALDLGDWVELVDDASVLNRDPAVLRRVDHIDPGALRVSLDAAPKEATGSDPGLHPLLRRWDEQPSPRQLASDNAIQMGPGPCSFALEDGIEVSFEAGSYRAGDFWSFWARVESDELDWPQQRSAPEASRLPDGVQRSYVPLAYVKGPKPGTVVDLRSIVTPLPGRDAKP